MKEIKNPSQYGYTGEERFEISASEFQLLKVALEQSLQNCIELKATEVKMYIDKDTQEKVENPSEQDLALGKILVMTDKQATFDPENINYTYDMKKLSREMLVAQEMITDIHLRNVEQGIAKHVDELKQKFQKVE
jgi:hypothetical protein